MPVTPTHTNVHTFAHKFIHTLIRNFVHTSINTRIHEFVHKALSHNALIHNTLSRTDRHARRACEPGDVDGACIFMRRARVTIALQGLHRMSVRKRRHGDKHGTSALSAVRCAMRGLALVRHWTGI